MKISITFLLILLLDIAHATVLDSIFIKELRAGLILNNNPDSIIHANWDKENNSWYSDKKYIYGYNVSSDKTFEELYVWYNNTWEQKDRIEFNYRTDLLVQQLNLWWDWAYFDWFPSKQYILAYDTIGNLILNNTYLWSDQKYEWGNDSLYTYKYNNEGSLTAFTKFKWYDYVFDYEAIEQMVYEYDNFGNNTKIVNQVWDSYYEIWQPINYMVFIYNANNFMVKQEMYTLNSNPTIWRISSRREYSYYENNLLLDEVIYRWDTSGDSIITDYKFEYYYDENLNLLEKIGSFFDSETLLFNKHYRIFNEYYDDKFLISSTINYWNDEQWKDLERSKFYYPGYVSQKLPVEYRSFNVYPNPANDKIFVSLGNETMHAMEIAIINFDGRLVSKNKIINCNHPIEINLSNVLDGIYFVQIRIDNQILTKKIVVNK